MRPLERYWTKVALTVGFLTILVLILLMSGMAKELSHLYRSITQAVSSQGST